MDFLMLMNDSKWSIVNTETEAKRQ